MRSPETLLYELNELLRDTVRDKAKTLIRMIERQKNIDTQFLYMNILNYLRWITQHNPPMYYEIIKSNVVGALFILQWIDPVYVRSCDGRYHSLLNTLYTDGAVDRNVYYNSITFIKNCVSPKDFPEIMRRDAMLFNPVARVVLDAILSYYGQRVEEGSRIAVIGSIGAGKTTLMFYTLYSILVGLGIDEKTAMEFTGKIITNKYEVLVKYFELVSENRYRKPFEQRLFIPLLAVDDVSTLVSKYWLQVADKKEREIALRLIKTLKITREGIGVVALLSDTTESIAKGMKEGIDLVLEGEKHRKEGLTYTLWALKKPSIKIVGKPWNPTAVDTIVETAHAYMGTVHKIMYIPSHIYDVLEEEKTERRRQILASSEVVSQE